MGVICVINAEFLSVRLVPDKIFIQICNLDVITFM